MRDHPYGDVPRLPDGPIAIADLAGGPGPFELELGFGRADFLLERARQRPDVRLVGLETRLKWVGLAAQKAKARSLENVHVYAGDARRLASVLGPDASVRTAWLHFPDPWWKKRHEKRRMVTPDLVRGLVRLLEDGGLLFVQTDVPERADAYRAMLRAQPALEDLRSDENPAGVRSHRERRCEEEGLPVYRLSFRRLAR